MKLAFVFLLFFVPSFVYARVRTHHTPIFLASIPKCGTHLVKKCICMLSPTSFSYPARTFFNAAERDFRRHNSILSHAPYNESLSQLIIDHNYKGIFMIRDPRAQAVSFIHFAHKSPKIWNTAHSIPFDELLHRWIVDTTLLKGTGRFSDPLIESFGDIADFYEQYLPWVDHPNFYTVQFEKLVGEKGGGSDEAQREEIRNIANHLGIELSDVRLKEMIEVLFGRSRTFRKGTINGWRDHFTSELKVLFKEIAGDLLIRLGYETDYEW